MTGDCKTFNGIAPDAFERLMGEARKRGYLVPAGSVGFINSQGVHAECRYDKDHQSPEICILKKPALVPAPVLWSALQRIAERYESGAWDRPPRRRGKV